MQSFIICVFYLPVPFTGCYGYGHLIPYIAAVKSRFVLDLSAPNDVDPMMDSVNSVIIDCAKKAKQPKTDSAASKGQERWAYTANENDPKKIWQAINWNGAISENDTTKENPADDEFKRHFESLLNPAGVEQINPTSFAECLQIPITDDPFTPEEVDAAIQNLRRTAAVAPRALHLDF